LLKFQKAKKDFYNLEKEENLVKKTCRELGITQKELAEKIGVNPRTITNWSNEDTKMPLMASKFLKILSIEKDYFELKETLSKTINRSF
jgi:DNA-binding XRE family transcriptional regulator